MLSSTEERPPLRFIEYNPLHARRFSPVEQPKSHQICNVDLSPPVPADFPSLMSVVLSLGLAGQGTRELPSASKAGSQL